MNLTVWSAAQMLRISLLCIAKLISVAAMKKTSASKEIRAMDVKGCPATFVEYLYM